MRDAGFRAADVHEQFMSALSKRTPVPLTFQKDGVAQDAIQSAEDMKLYLKQNFPELNIVKDDDVQVVFDYLDNNNNNKVTRVELTAAKFDELTPVKTSPPRGQQHTPPPANAARKPSSTTTAGRPSPASATRRPPSSTARPPTGTKHTQPPSEKKTASTTATRRPETPPPRRTSPKKKLPPPVPPPAPSTQINKNKQCSNILEYASKTLENIVRYMEGKPPNNVKELKQLENQIVTKRHTLTYNHRG